MIIFEYSNYREYIKDQVLELRKKEDFSFRGFSARAGFKSPNFLQLVMNGKRNLSLDGARKVAEGFDLSSKERNYFEHLVLANQAKSLEEKQKFTDELLKLKRKNSPSPETISNYDYYKYWYNIPIREALLIKGGSQAIQHLAESFQPPLLPSQIEAALNTLSDLKLIKKDSKGHWVASHETLKAPDLLINSLILNFHMKMLDLAKESMIRFRGHEREVSSATISISKENFEKLRAILKDCKAQALTLAEEDKNKQDVYQLNIQLFPLTQGLKK
jgi:uncharacterized protein (TIGR02147 family)